MTEINSLKLKQFESVSNIQDTILNVQNAGSVIKSNEAHEKLKNPENIEKLVEKLCSITETSQQMLQLLEQESVQKERTRRNIEQLCELLTKYKQLRSTTTVTMTDKQVDRLIYKTNFMRSLTAIFISMIDVKDMDKVQHYLNLLRKVSVPRCLDYYRDLVEAEETLDE